MTTPPEDHPYRRIADRIAQRDPKAGRELHESLNEIPSLEKMQELIDQGNRLVEKVEEQNKVMRSQKPWYVVAILVGVLLAFITVLRMFSRGS
jgi:chromatin segregation and condensation protein Rec8/ScpA/Scc1 (kleisin family)